MAKIRDERKRKPAAPVDCGDIDIRIGSDGTWYHQGSPIGRKELVQLFARALTRAADGAYWLVTPAEKARIWVDDAPFVGVELARDGSGPAQALRLRTNVDDWVVIGPDHPLRVTPGPGGPGRQDPKPYVAIRPGLDALIARPVYYELAALAVEGTDEGRPMMGVWSAGMFFALGKSVE